MIPPRDETLAAAFEAMQPRRDRKSTEPSEARAYIRANFDTIQSARQRGLTWAQITEALINAGVKAADGSPLQWRMLKSLFHAERYATRGERRKRRTKKRGAQSRSPDPPATTQQPRDAVPFDPNDGAPDDKPRPKFSISRPK
jgi:hypothetical protein